MTIRKKHDGQDRGGGLLKSMFDFAQTGKASEGLRQLFGSESVEELEKLVGRERATNPPRIVVIGKAGVGKTTTINNLFSAQFRTSHALQGTSQAQLHEFALRGGGSLHVVDLPGLGEGIAEDRIFADIYRDELPKSDVVLYILEADERLLGEDQRIFNEVVIPALTDGDLNRLKAKRLVVGLNKVDLIGPGQWDTVLNYPDPQQEQSIQYRAADIADKLVGYVPDLVGENIIYYSAEQRYRLHDLLLALVTSAGESSWKLPVAPADPLELASSEVREFAADWRRKHKKWN